MRLDDIKDHTCSISCETLEKLAEVQQKKGLPFVVAAIDKKVSEVTSPLFSDPDRFDFFDALKLNLYITSRYENPNNRQAIERIIYLWNGIYSDNPKSFHIDPSSLSIIQDINAQTEQRQKILYDITNLAVACQSDDRDAQLSAQITLARKLWEEKPEESAFWIQQIYNTFKYAFLQEINFNTKLYINQLRDLYRISQSSLIYSCLCISELKSDFCIEAALDTLLEENPSDTLALTLKGVLYAFEGSFAVQDSEKAQKYLIQALQSDNTIRLAWSALIECNATKAYEMLREFLRSDPENTVLLRMFSKAAALEYNVHSDLEEDFPLIQKLCELVPDDAFAHACLGRVFMAGSKGVESDEKKALFHLKKANELDPGNAIPHAYLGVLRRMTSDEDALNLQKAYFHLRMACELDPSCAFAHGHLGALLAVGGEGVERDVKEACFHLTKASELDPSDAFHHLHLGILRMANGDEQDLQRAYVHLKRACELDPDNACAHANLGALLVIRGEDLKEDESETAYSHLMRAYELDPEDAFTHARLGILLVTGEDGCQQDLKRAHFHLMKACELDSTDPIAYACLGDLLRVGGNGIKQDVRRACELLEKACELNPNVAFAHASLGEILLYGGDGIEKNLQKAHFHLEQACNLNPDDASAHDNLHACRAALHISEDQEG